MKLGEILSELREERNLTQVRLADELHISNSCISSYETGSRQPSLGTLSHYADYFQVTTDYLLGKTTEKTMPELSGQFINDVPLASVVNMMISLNPEQKSALLMIIQSFYAEVIRGEKSGESEK